MASGENSAKPHARPGTRVMGTGDPVVVDFGATFDGYRSDMTRTFCVGGEPTRRAWPRCSRWWRPPQALGVAAVAPGVVTGDVDKACRDRIAEAGWAERFEHGTGHGVGLDIHEGPAVGAGSTAILQPGTVVTVEPGVYLPDVGGVRIEDTLVVTDHRQPTTHPIPEGSPRLMSVSTNDLRNGMTLNLPEGLFNVIEFQHVKPGKGGAFVRTKLKNQRTGAVIERTYRADEKLDQAIIDKREMQFLYRDGGDYVFMDTRSYDQLQVETGLLGDAAKYLKEGDDAVLEFFGDEIVGVELPAAVELTIAETEPGLQGDRVSGARKPATLETGLVIQVPLFVNPGEKVRVDTRTGEYLTRA